MGCFDSNCCLTGLPIKYYDPVYAGLVAFSPDRNFYFGSPASSWQFLTPPIRSIYNDYGNIEFSDIKESDRVLLDLFLRLWKPGFDLEEHYPDKDYAEEPKAEWSLEKTWNGCMYSVIQFDPNRWRRNEVKAWQQAGCPEDETKPAGWAMWRRADKYPVYETEPVLINGWMCHEWAWDHLYELNISYRDKLAVDIDQLCTTDRSFNEMLNKKFGEYARKDESHTQHREAWEAWFDHTNREYSSIVGSNGAFYKPLKNLIKNVDAFDSQLETDFNLHREVVKEAIIDTTVAVKNMYTIRKNIIPMSTCGEQHESFEHLLEWSKLVACKCEEMCNERL